MLFARFPLQKPSPLNLGRFPKFFCRSLGLDPFAVREESLRGSTALSLRVKDVLKSNAVRTKNLIYGSEESQERSKYKVQSWRDL